MRAKLLTKAFASEIEERDVDQVVGIGDEARLELSRESELEREQSDAV
jgi:hypothetical protein